MTDPLNHVNTEGSDEDRVADSSVEYVDAKEPLSQSRLDQI